MSKALLTASAAGVSPSEEQPPPGQPEPNQVPVVPVLTTALMKHAGVARVEHAWNARGARVGHA